MSARTPNTLITLLRASGSTIRPTVLQTTRPFSQLRARSPSPSPSSLTRNAPLTSSTQWTRFRTPSSLSSTRTFVQTARPSFSASTAARASHSDSPNPESAQAIAEAIEKIQDMYGSARDEFEMAAEETEKNTTYAEEDRAAAREELDALLDYYTSVIEGGDRAVAEEVKNRVGGRIRELEQAVLGMEESVANGDDH